MRNPVHPPRSAPLIALSAIILAGAVALGCGDSGTEPTPTATFQFSGTIAGFPGLDLVDARITITDAGGATLATTTVSLSSDPTSDPGQSGPASFTATLEVEASGTLTYESEVRGGGGTALYLATGTLEGGVDRTVTISSFDYVGPGSEVVTVEIELDPGASLRVGQEVTAAASLLDGSGTSIPNVPVHWEVANGDLELLSVYTQGGRAYADFRATSVTAAEDIELTLPSQVGGSASVEIQEPVLADAAFALTLPLFPGIGPTHIRIELVGDVSRDTLIVTTQPQVAAPSDVDLQLAVPVDVTFDDVYTAVVTVLQSEMALYRAEGVVVVGGGDAVPVSLDYIGPGAEASALDVVLQETEVTVGQSTVATATARDASGTVIQGVPIAWDLESPGLTAELVDLRQGPASLTVDGGLDAGTYQVVAFTPTGIQDTTSLTLLQPPSDSAYIDFDTYPDGSATVEGPLTTEYTDWGIVFSFVPYSSSQGQVAGPHLFKSGSDGLIENGENLAGSRTYGFFIFEYLTPVTEVVVELTGYAFNASTDLFVVDADGNDVTSSATITSTGYTQRIQYDGGIGKVAVDTGNYRMLVFSLTHK